MLALDPKYKMRKAKKNVFFYRFDPDQMDLADQKALHSNIAIILSFFDGHNSINDILSAIEYLLDMTKDEATLVLDKILDEWKSFMIDVQHKVRNDKPADFIIPVDKIDCNVISLEAPLYLSLNITQRCGACRCVYCYAEKKDSRPLGEMSFDQIVDILKQARELKMEIITLSGGDAFVRQDITDNIEMIVESDINLQISTKQFLSEYTISRLKDIGIDQIQISIDCIDNALSKRLTGIPKFAQRVLDTIRKLKESGITVTTNSVITGLNAHDVPALVNKLVSMGIEKIRLSQYYRSAYRHSDDLFITEEQGIKLQDFVEKFNATHEGVTINLSLSITPRDNEESDTKSQNTIKSFVERPMCSAGKLSMLILPNGKVIPCEQMPCIQEFILGDATVKPIKEIWNSSRFQGFFSPERLLFKGTVCYDCEYFDLCVLKKGWCMRDAWKAYDTIYQVNPMCPKAETVPGKRMS